MEKEDFLPHIGGVIKVKRPNETDYDLMIKKVYDLTSPPEGASEMIRKKPFQVMLQGSKSEMLDSCIYSHVLPDGKAFDLVSIAESEYDDCYQYCITIN